MTPQCFERLWLCCSYSSHSDQVEWVHNSVRGQVMQERTRSSTRSNAANAKVVTILNKSASSDIRKVWWPTLVFESTTITFIQTLANVSHLKQRMHLCIVSVKTPLHHTVSIDSLTARDRWPSTDMFHALLFKIFDQRRQTSHSGW